MAPLLPVNLHYGSFQSACNLPEAMTGDRMSESDVLPSSEAELGRLERQATLYRGLDFLRPCLAERPWEVLAVGCGTGYFTSRVAAALPESRITGLDMDEGRPA